MSLIKCPECEKEISTTAKSCPNCGYKSKKGKKEKILLLFTSLLLLIVLGISFLFGYKAIQSKKYNAKLNEAEGLYNAKEYQLALAIYNELINIKDNPEIQNQINTIELKLRTIKAEQERYDKSVEFVTFLKDLQKNRIRSGISVSLSDMEYIINDLREEMDKFEAIPVDDSPLSEFIINIKDSLNYEFMRIQVDSNLFKDTGLTDGLGQIDSSFRAINTLTVANARNTINDAINFIKEKNIPLPNIN